MCASLPGACRRWDTPSGMPNTSSLFSRDRLKGMAVSTGPTQRPEDLTRARGQLESHEFDDGLRVDSEMGSPDGRQQT